MSKISLVSHIRKLALSWTVAGIIFTVTLSASIFIVILFKDAEREMITTALAVVGSSRADILSGDIRTIELELQKQFEIQETEKLLFLDSNRQRWVTGNANDNEISFCNKPDGLCQNIFSDEIKLDFPIYFDSEKTSLWGYLHIEKHIRVHWPLVASVMLATILGMIFQALGFYFNIVKSIKAVGATMESWAQKLSIHPKNVSKYETAPFSEVIPIETALKGLKNEIDLLEDLAREEGALTTLRGIGHDILNPVARMKRIIGLMQIKNTLNDEGQILAQNLSSNLKRLSAYAEQLKLLYKYKTGEVATQSSIPVLDLSAELKMIAKDLAFDPDVLDKKIEISSSIEDGCLARIPSPILGRMIENIVGNSIQASRENSTVQIKTSINKNEVHLFIEDQGSGIADEIKEKIFLPDFTTKASKGTGLGLFVVKQLCEHYGGIISLESQQGKGTKIQLSFPRAELV